MAKKVLTVVLVVAALVLVATFALSQTGRIGSVPPEQRSDTLRQEEDPYRPYMGWYELEPAHHVLVTWAAQGGMRVLDLDAHKFDLLSAGVGGSFVWQRRGRGLFTREVWFEKDAAVGVTRLRWRGEDGEEGSAPKVLDYGYGQDEVHFANGEVNLVGTLLIPPGRGPHPAAVFIHGSGSSDRDNLWYFAIADYLARNGIAALLPDKRGSGQSGGEWRTASFTDFAHDTLAAVALLRTREEIDGKHIGLLGISQGGWIAPLAASQSPEIAFVINVSGSAVTPDEQLLHESEQTLQQEGWPGLAAKGMASGAAAMARMRRPTWWRKNGDFDPIPFWEKVRVPVLVVYGEDDEKDNVPIQESVVRLNKMIQADRAHDFTVTVFPNTGHGMFNAETKWIRKDFLDLLVDWSRSRAKQDWTGAAREGQE